MTVARKTTAKPKSPKAAKAPVFAPVGADYSRDIAIMRERQKTWDRSPEAARARLLASGLIVKNGVLRVDTSR